MSKRIVVWGTGFVGKLVLAEVFDHPEFELVGVGVSNPEKVGVDVGTLCGRDPFGILCTDDLEALVALKPDALVHYGPTAQYADENIRVMTAFLRAGVDVITGGNHTVKINELIRYLIKEPRLLRPYNMPAGTPGNGLGVYECEGRRIGVVSLQGRVFMGEIESPFSAAERALAELRGQCDAVVIDFHAEATSEKVALAHFLDGRVAAVVGTHTHVQTADARVLPGGTAYISDLGMVGPIDSVIGVKKEIAVERFLTGRRLKLEVAAGTVEVDGVLITVDPAKGLATEIHALRVPVEV